MNDLMLQEWLAKLDSWSDEDLYNKLKDFGIDVEWINSPSEDAEESSHES